MSEPRNKGTLPDDVAVLKARVDGVESMVQRSLVGMGTCFLLIALVCLVLLKSGALHA